MVMLMYDAENSRNGNGQNGVGYSNGNGHVNGTGHNGNGANGTSEERVSFYTELKTYAVDALRGAAKNVAVEIAIAPFTVMQAFDTVRSGNAPVKFRQRQIRQRDARLAEQERRIDQMITRR